jgi:tyrosine-protein kinase Etk/Wzc
MTDASGPQLLLSVLRDRRARMRIVAVTAVFAVGGFVYGLVAPRWYRAVLTIVPASTPRSAGVSSLLGSDLGGLATGLAAVGGVNADAARIVAVLQSNSVTDGAIDKFGLMDRYGSRFRESAREEVWNRCEARVLPKPNLVQASCEDTDPRFAQELLAFLADHGNQVFRRVTQTSASEEARFLEARAAELRIQADETAARLREFEERHHVVDLDAQARAVVSEVAAITSQRNVKQMDLEYARTFSSSDEATTRQLESQLSVVDAQLMDLERRQAEPGPRTKRREGKGSMFPPALDVPKLRAEFEKLFRDRKVAETTLVYVLERLEGAKASEARNVSTFQVLDPPTLPGRKTRPGRAFVLAVSALVGLAASVAFEWWRAGGGKLLGRNIEAHVASRRKPPGTHDAG